MPSDHGFEIGTSIHSFQPFRFLLRGGFWTGALLGCCFFRLFSELWKRGFKSKRGGDLSSFYCFRFGNERGSIGGWSFFKNERAILVAHADDDGNRNGNIDFEQDLQSMVGSAYIVHD